MPELPEVETVKEVLKKRYLNKTISDVLVNYDNILANISTITEADILTILNSKIITETLICQIESFANEEDAIVCIPEGDLKKENSDGTKDRTAWLENGNEHGELYNVLNAITIVFNGQNLDDMSFSTDISSSSIDVNISVETDISSKF